MLLRTTSSTLADIYYQLSTIETLGQMRLDVGRKQLLDARRWIFTGFQILS